MDDPNPLPPHMIGGGGITSGGITMSRTNNRKRGWAGDEMEMNHMIQQKLTSSTNHHSSATTAMDLTQFRNEEAGKGYQAKGVIRQKSIVTGDLKIIDMSKKKETTSESNNATSYNDTLSSVDAKLHKSKKQKRSRGKDEKNSKHDKNKNNVDDNTKETLELYLKCEGIRILRKEIETIIMEEAKSKR